MRCHGAQRTNHGTEVQGLGTIGQRGQRRRLYLPFDLDLPLDCLAFLVEKASLLSDLEFCLEVSWRLRAAAGASWPEWPSSLAELTVGPGLAAPAVLNLRKLA